MIFILGMAIAGGIVRMAAPYVRDLVVAKELTKPGMQFIEVAKITTPVDGVWQPQELGRVVEALMGGDREIVERGQERAQALRRAGCPECGRCKKLFPGGLPDHCDRCGLAK